MTFKIKDEVKGSRQEPIVLSTITWYDFQQKVTEVLNIFPSKLQLQYHFSNENKTSLPFNLNSHMSFGSISHKLRPLVMPATLKNGKKSAHKMKVVMVKLFNRDTEGEGHGSSVKNSKVSVSPTPWLTKSWIQTCRILLNLPWVPWTLQVLTICCLRGRWLPERRLFKSGIASSIRSQTNWLPVGMIRTVQVSVFH